MTSSISTSTSTSSTISTSPSLSLSQLGWTPYFQQQLSLQEWENHTIGRIAAHHRATIEYITIESGKCLLPITSGLTDLTVGDWILLDSDQRFVRSLTRLSSFSRKAPGSKVAVQHIAANISTVFVVCSLNQNFNLSRIERYLALANEAGVEPVVVLTKADCCDDPQDYLDQVRSLDPMLMVEAVNALDSQSVKILEPWCKVGKTVAFVGSSGVGKSTLVNCLLGELSTDNGQQTQLTASERLDDSRGRHTTTSRSLHLMPAGGLLLDTPGMRELQLADCDSGIAQTFDDIVTLAVQCRFADCQHHSEPGCAVQLALAAGELEQRRLTNYLKLMKEQAHNSATLAEKRAKDRDLGRFYRRVQTDARQRRKG
ncbi:MAG: ribosome biogenesis GTPase [Phenylobacterium sp.]|jgi:ribosome biogenesis GTPase